MPLPLLGEKALGSGGKSEDQPSIGKKAGCSRCKGMLGDTYFLYYEFSHKTQRCILSMRIRVLLYKFQGAVCREDNASPFFKIINYFNALSL